AIGQSVTLEGVVVVPTFRLNATLSAFFLSDGTREPYSGILVRFPTTQGLQFGAGDKVSVTGRHHEYFCMTQFAATAATKVGTASVPSARTIGKNLLPADIEPWESVIVQVDNVTVTSHTEFDDAETNAGVLIEDMVMGDAFVLPAVGTVFPRIRGALTFGFERFRVAPRSAADLSQ
ncbi:MAG TPA: hypothetical protein PK095_12785, partial [Myxococcota bacterium]|nr:hypothetical protein [Myxococcota bacterium]